MDRPDNKKIQALRSDAQKLDTTLQVGKAGLSPQTVEELKAQLRKRKLVKVGLLPSSLEGADIVTQAQALADASGSLLVEVRGKTAVFWKA